MLRALVIFRSSRGEGQERETQAKNIVELGWGCGGREKEQKEREIKKREK